MDFLKSIFYLENFINYCFKTFLDNKHRRQEKVITVPKKSFLLVLPRLEILSFQIRINWRKAHKGILNCLKLHIVFQSQNKSAKAFSFKNRIPKYFTSGIVYKIQAWLCNKSYYDEGLRHLNDRNGENIGISSLTKSNDKSKGSGVSDHLLLCKCLSYFESFSVLTKGNRKFVRNLVKSFEESLLIMIDKPSLRTNIRSATLYLFYGV